MANADDEPGQADFDRFVAGGDGRTGSGIEHGSVTVLDVDRNDPDLLTLRAVRALHAADVILFDGQVSHEILDFARREARKIRIGKTRRDGEIDAMMAELKKPRRARGATQVPRPPQGRSGSQADVPPHRSALVPDDEIMAAN